MRALLLAAAVLAILGLALTDRAGACSCAAQDARDRLPSEDYAVIGTIVDGGDPARLRVEERIKGEVPDEIELANPESGGTCEPDFRKGEQAGLFLRRSADGGWSTSLCDRADVEELRRAARALPEARGSGRAALIATTFGDLAGIGAVLLDAEGAVLAYGEGQGWQGAAVCPGSTHIVTVAGEGRLQRLVTRRLLDLKVVRSRALPRDEVFSYGCRDRTGRRIAVVDGLFDEPAPVRARLRLLGPGRDRTLRRGKIAGAMFIGDTAYLSEGRWGRDLVAVDLRTAAATRIARVPEIPGEWHLSPDRRHLATTAHGRGGANPHVIVVVDLRTGRVRTRSDSGSVLWVGPGRLLSEGTLGVQLLDSRLRTLRRSDQAVSEWPIVATGGRVYGLDHGDLYELDRRTARPRRLATLPSRAFRALVAIPDAAEIRTKRGASALSTQERRLIRAAFACRRSLW